MIKISPTQFYFHQNFKIRDIFFYKIHELFYCFAMYKEKMSTTEIEDAREAPKTPNLFILTLPCNI